LRGDEKSAARLISLVEDKQKVGYEQLAQLLPRTGKAHIAGVAGPVGAGKSTLIAKLVGRMCDQGHKIGIIAFDPTSVQSQGAFVGDRVRMKEIAKVFVYVIEHSSANTSLSRHR
jgi:LAO/AO transport system kinase